MFDIRHAGQAAQALADEGYAVWSIEYRRVGDPGGGWPNTFVDVAPGIDHLRELATSHRLDIDRVFAVGHSVWANFAIWAAARPKIPESSDVYMPQPLPIRGVLGLAPAPTLGSLHAANVCGGVVDSLLGGSPEDVPERYDAVSPMRLMPDGVSQRLVIGAYDQAWGPSGRAYYEAAQADGSAPVTMVEAPESGHFEVIAPQSSTWRNVLTELRRLVEGN